MSRKCNLRTVSDRAFEKVYVQEDLTPKQREILTQLYRDAEEKNAGVNLAVERWIVAGRRTQPFLKKVPARRPVQESQ